MNSWSVDHYVFDQAKLRITRRSESLRSFDRGGGEHQRGEREHRAQ
jgi:hypothetical protein